MSKRLVIVAFLAASLIPAPGWAASDPGHPWDKAIAVVHATEADIPKGGFRAIQPHVADLEAALAGANQAYQAEDTGSGPIYRLTDGPRESLLAMLKAAADSKKSGRNAIAVENPYPRASYYLGAYYNEIGQPADALRVLNTGLALPTVEGAKAGEFQPLLITEKAAAYAGMKRWQDAFNTYNDGAQIKGLDARNLARMLRGRGAALTELGRLDEAEKSYRDSLVAEPNNQLAQRELVYIQRLRSGGPGRPAGLVTPNKPPGQP